MWKEAERTAGVSGAGMHPAQFGAQCLAIQLHTDERKALGLIAMRSQDLPVDSYCIREDYIPRDTVGNLALGTLLTSVSKKAPPRVAFIVPDDS